MQALEREYDATALTAEDLVAADPDSEALLDAIPARVVGGRRLYPAWVLSQGRLRTDLEPLVQALRHYTSDAIAVDRVMRLPREELGGRRLIDAIDDPDASPTAWTILDSLGEG